MSKSANKSGKVYLVGAGPGDLGLVTLRAKECIENADVIVYDHLANPDMLGWARDDAEIIYAGKQAGESRTQQEITSLLLDKAREGKQVVRLKGGDPFVFGRGAEEAQEIATAGIPFEIVPGITSAIAGPAIEAGAPAMKGSSGTDPQTMKARKVIAAALPGERLIGGNPRSSVITVSTQRLRVAVMTSMAVSSASPLKPLA